MTYACLVVLSMAILFGAGERSARAEDKIIRLSTGSISEMSYSLGVAISAALSNPEQSESAACDEGGSCGVPGLLMLVRDSLGAQQNVVAVQNGDSDLAIVQSDVAHYAFSGTGPFTGSAPKYHLRAIGYMYPKVLHILVREESSIHHVSDLRHKSVSLGSIWSGSYLNAHHILRAYGLDHSDISAKYIDTELAIDRLIDQDLDAIFVTTGMPARGIDFLASEVPIRLLPIQEDPLKTVLAQHPYFSSVSIPAGWYSGTQHTPTVQVGALLLVRETVAKDLVYHLTKALWHPKNRRIMDRIGGVDMAALPRNASTGVSIPLHDGAIQYYQELGVTSPDLTSAKR